MQIVIDISDKMFDPFKKHGIMTFDNLDEYDRDMIADAIANGTPLPKGHGDLIDRDALKDELRWATDCVSCWRGIDTAKTVIKADKGET